MHELTQSQIDAHAARQARISDANGAALPGPLLEAFLPEALTAAGFTLREMVPSDEPILLRLNSPLIQRLKNGKSSEVDLSPEAEAARWHDLWELLFLWTRPVAEARAAFSASPRLPISASSARDRFREVALAATADQLPASVLMEAQSIMQALAANYLRAFSTIIAYQARPSGDGTVFTQPPMAPATASAGGSTSSAASPPNSTPTRAPSPTNGHSRSASPTQPGPSRTTHGATPSAPATAT